MIRVENVSYSYQAEEGPVAALTDVNLSIERGDFVAIIGHNGSGKSTLAKMFNGLLIPSQGRVTVMGKPLPTRSRTGGSGNT